MFRFIKETFVVTMPFFGGITLSCNALKCILMNTQECNIRAAEIININSDGPILCLSC